MKSASSATLAILAAGEYLVAELFDFTLQFGSTVYHFTNFDVPLSAAIYPSGTPNNYLTGLTIERGDMKQKVGLDADEMDLIISPQYDSPGGPPTIGGYPFMQACDLGLLDGALVQMSRLYMLPPAPGTQLDTSPGAVAWFKGLVGETNAGRLNAQIKVLSHASLLTVQMPRAMFAVGCSHNVYDAGCTLLKSTFTVSGTVTAVADPADFSTSLTQVNNYFNLGVITWNTGTANAGLSFSVKLYSNSGGGVQLFTPLPVAPNIGDGFTIYPGCDHLQSTCQNNNSSIGPPFNNIAHFKGEPYVPVPETILDGGTDNPPAQVPGYQSGQIIGSATSSNAHGAK